MEKENNNSTQQSNSNDVLFSQRRQKILGTLDTKWDYFLDSHPLQPKSEIAEYIESQWILVPKRFSWLTDAIASWKPFIARSEHPVEYYWAAWLHDSYKIINPREFVLDEGGYWSENIKLDLSTCSQQKFESLANKIALKRWSYPFYLGIDKEQYFNKLSYSYWELLEWLNRSIVADSAIVWRYHIFTTSSEAWFNKYHNYTVYDNGKLFIDWPNKITSELWVNLENTIEMYEKIRHFPKFNPTHCPIVEFQTVHNNNYFLQYHRTRDQDVATFTLSWKSNQNQIEIPFVRGKTNEQWDVYKIWVQPMPTSNTLSSLALDGAIVQWYNMWVHEILTRKHKLQIDLNQLDMMIAKTEDLHLPKSKIFNWELFLNVPDAISRIKLVAMIDNFYARYYPREWKEITWNDTLLIKVISDGRKALIEYLE